MTAIDALVSEITAAAATIESVRDNPDVLRRVLMPHVRRLGTLCSDAVTADDAETRDIASTWCREIFGEVDLVP